MKIRVADYIAKKLVENGITSVFSVVGGGAMHLNDAFGRHEDLHCIYNHHEQGCAIAAEGYARIHNKMAVTCVTTGPGGTNAITGVLCSWLDSIPMLVISGQTRYATTVESTALNLRQFGEQEYNIVDSVRPMTKYAVMVNNPNEIRYHVEKAIFEATNGRKGPCWIDIPLDIQGAMVDESELVGFTANQENTCTDSDIEFILGKIEKAQAPVLILGSAVRQSSCLPEVYELVSKLNIPVLCPTSIADIFENSYPLYFGNFGVFGGRTGNFIIQNADLVVSLGARMSFKQTGFNFSAFAPNAEKIIVDIDAEELKKDTIKIEYPIHADLSEVAIKLNNLLQRELAPKNPWLKYCGTLKEKFMLAPEIVDRGLINPYFLANELLEKAPADNITVVGNSCACVSVLQMGISKRGQRLFGSVNCGTMGYDIPAAIGAAIASGKKVLCATGDGSFQMNIQEIQTIIHNNLPVKFIIFNNFGYQAIVQTQTNFFGGALAGCTNDSGISFPSFEKISFAYGLPFKKISTHEEVSDGLDWLLGLESYGLLEVIQDTQQPIEPKVMSKKLLDGSMYSPPIDDLSPFLSEEEYVKYGKFFN
ncbi:thiamine pyrophosphate-binding protein [Paenibacillus taichungensis]|uniref:Thiamine pyrophosphate-binding protein n=1 Tax=Paenibacillus taichungensis TaxID=484184 RepID=A0A329QHW3_9BACL|nr:thiamine pyrophosphate-binding protein [Paenibacillus taichungensis]RAW09978.1 thiamine pyrophosphate-binding protein [Paenibacillus taichungensis]